MTDETRQSPIFTAGQVGVDVNHVTGLFDAFRPKALKPQQVQSGNHVRFPNLKRRNHALTPVNDRPEVAA